jgi:hypothetical protein
VLAGNQIAALQASRAQAPTRVVIADRAGHRLAASPPMPPFISSLSFDGRYASWIARPCAQSNIVVWDTTTGPPMVPNSRCGVLRPTTRLVHVRPRQYRITLPLRCPQQPTIGCTDRFALTAKRQTLRPSAPSALSVTAAAGTSTNVVLCLPPGARRRHIPSNHPLRLRLVETSGVSDGRTRTFPIAIDSTARRAGRPPPRRCSPSVY